MTPKKVLEVINLYHQRLAKMGIDKTDYPPDELLKNTEMGLAHCHGMLDKMVGFVHEERMDKVFRWLGFIQGVLWTIILEGRMQKVFQCLGFIQGFLWAKRVYTLDDFKNHNRPDF